ncbi:MAG: LytTR family DNA-binding domain-containing protein [Eubacteriales bacterium]|nr:LytTR family DNA-binding domain-containing protein [Eubacteriales bacterium]
MKSMTIAICDPIEEDALLLKGLLKKLLPEMRAEIFSTGEQLLEKIERQTGTFAIAFLEIQLPGIGGIEVAKAIRGKDLLIPIIFTTNDNSYYREAFDVLAFQYLLKPVKHKTVEQSLRPLKLWWKEKTKNMLYFRYRSQTHILELSQISYISSSLHTVNFHLTNGEIVHCRGKLNDFEEQLRNTDFLRCHQSFFVNMREVTSMKVDCFKIKDEVIPISRSYAKETQLRYKRYLNAEPRSDLRS